ncbi:G-type lectin S-receptor-like serine/threonine-protein kinase At4g27290 isoform X2 [Jatropha curcas]|uniref:G-type lectin S-receptor-like serine/threonine-protein kinase At4g27290 isoform X2 n=1 Tax=Jatropha curcas TaxID=180498 RepID=UPI0009D6A90A|nr:G-type lectin S-receptor-like serine/threonine-protein kinase At4g27290 isoform X2 [Jatropha curcas]
MECISILCCFLLLITITTAADTMNITQSIRDRDGETIVSAGERFRLGFFSPGNSKNRYLGIWHNKVPESAIKAVWVANRKTPLTDLSGIFKMTDQGILVLTQNATVIWSTNSTTPARKPVAQLLDSGNLIVRNEGDNTTEYYLWQSFDYPSDTFLSGMKLGRNRVTGLDTYISSWKTIDDPFPGDYTYGLDPIGYPQMIVRRNSTKLNRVGPWNGVQFSGMPQLRPNPLYKYEFVLNAEEIYSSYTLQNKSLFSMITLNQHGILEQLAWINEANDWAMISIVPRDKCDIYAVCGAYGVCNINYTPMCSCIKGFVSKVPKEWEMDDWSSGCVVKTPVNCSQEFRKYSGVKLPETRTSWFNDASFVIASMSLDDCKFLCTKNCSCSAYANLDIRQGGHNCLLWFSELIDIRELEQGGQDIYIRMAASESGLLFLGLALVLFWKRKWQRNSTLETIVHNKGQTKEDLELTFFDLGTIASATNKFSPTNKLGEGGFGPVYKGILKDGQEIAVKRLSKNSRQGLDEFSNEVIYIARLQHRNLVKILGCCIQANERMLIYEFLPNKSLDFFIFDQKQSIHLDWPQRYHIINGIARGLLYLHQDSRLRIVHRDLKVGNILLDYEMNPKISDFGLARSFGGNETEANTNKVVGTHGYMSPEYVIDGRYSMKSDIFSFGVMVLEIVSGKRNRGFYHPEHNGNLLGHAWTLHKEGRTFELIAASVTESCNQSEVQRSIQVGLLCVQQNPEDRPAMSNVVLMLGGEGALPAPKKPGFFTERDLNDLESSSSKQKPPSLNCLTITLPEAR